MSQRILAPLITIADALLAVVLGVLIPLICTTAIWAAAGLTGDWTLAFATAVGAWALSIGGDLVVTLDAGVLGPLGIADPISFGVGLAPLALTLATIIPGLRSGARFRVDDSPLAVGLLGPVAFAAAAWGLAAAASHAAVDIDALGTALIGGLIYLASLAVGARVWERIPDDALERYSAGWGPDGLAAIARGAGIMLVGVVAGASLLAAIGMLLGFGQVIAAFEALPLDIVGTIVFGLAQLAFIPNAIVWAMSWMLGPGFSIGDGSSVAPLATNAGPLPLVPILGGIPQGLPAILIVVVVLPVAAGVFGGLAMRLAPDADAWNTAWRRFATPLLAALVSALAIAILGLAAGGAIGPGRLETAGPHAGWMLLAAFATLAVGALTGAVVPLADVDPSGSAGSAATRSESGSARGATARTRAGGNRRRVGSARDPRDLDDGDGVHDDEYLNDEYLDDEDDDQFDEEDLDDDEDEFDEDELADEFDEAFGTDEADDVDDVEVDDQAKRDERGRGDGIRKRSRFGIGRGGAKPSAAASRGTSKTGRDGDGADASRTQASPATAAKASPRTPRDDDEPDIYAGIDPLADDDAR